jgi:oxygen-dependent protoporphyrinogen oxidase
LQLIEELGMTDQLITANPGARQRYVQVNGKLHPVPMGPIDLIGTSLLPLKDKWSLVAGIFKKNISTDSTIYDYVSQRFSSNIAESLIDPLMSGIYAGDIKRLHMASTFPKLKKSRMRSFQGGMGQIIEALEKRYKKYIQTNSEIFSGPLKTDVTIVATPAYVGAKIIGHMNPVLSRILDQIPYAPIAVAGLLFKQSSFKKKPDGFGYLIASREKKDVLGVLIESNVFDGRAGDDQVMMRVMLGGVHHPAIINDDQDQIIAKAIKEIDSVYGLREKPLETFVKQWPKAIPQYEINYPPWRRSVAEQCDRTPGLYLCANYLDGISFNDCIKNAKSLSAAVTI